MIVFLIGPFRAENHYEQMGNIREAKEAAVQVWSLSASCICPHLNSGVLFGVLPEEVFLKGYKEILLKCDAAFVFSPRWESSEGSREEVRLCEEEGLLVFWCLEALEKYLSD